MTVKMLTSQMLKEFITIEVPEIAVLAQRMASMRFVVHIALTAMDAQIGSRITATFKRKDLRTNPKFISNIPFECNEIYVSYAQILRTNITVELFVLFLDMVTECGKRSKRSK